MKEKNKSKKKAKSEQSLRASILEILRKHDPALIEGKGVPAWSVDIADRVRKETLARGLGDLGIQCVNSFLHDAEVRGLGPLGRLSATRNLQITASRIRYMKAEDYRFVTTLIDRINSTFGELSGCDDPHVIGGLAILSGALHSGIVIPQHLRQLLIRNTTLEEAMGFTFVCLDLERRSNKAKCDQTKDTDRSNERDEKHALDIEKRDGHTRRQALQPATALLVRTYRAKIDQKPWPSAIEALTAALQFLGLPTLDLGKLSRLAKGYWALHLPSWMLEVMQNPDLCPSVNQHTWNRWVRNDRERASEIPLPESGLGEEVLLGFNAPEGPDCIDGNRLGTATSALISTLRRKKKEPAVDQDIFVERLKAWRQTHGQLGGWLNPLHDWLVFQATGKEGGVFSKTSPLRASALMRYCSGFFHIVMEETRLIPFAGARNDLSLEYAIQRIAQRILSTKSPMPGVVGFRNFLYLLRQKLQITPDLDECFDVAGLPVLHRCRLITLSDYRNARALIHQRYGNHPLAELQLKVALALGYRAGLRSGELCSRQIADFKFVTNEGKLQADLRIRTNEIYDLKSLSSKRTIPLHVLMTQDEMMELYSFLDMRKASLEASARESDLPFSDLAMQRARYLDREICSTIQEILRDVTFDKNVVFHDLRHSAASFMMIRILDEGQFRHAFGGIPDYAAMRSEFGDHLPLSFSLNGPQEDHPSRLYALARILGHLDPRTSLMYYVHTADFIIACALQREIRLPLAVRSMFGTIKADSLRRREQRHRSGVIPRPKKRTLIKKGSAASNRRPRVTQRHSHGLVGSYSADTTRKILLGIVSDNLSSAKRKSFGITDDAIEKAFDVLESGMTSSDALHLFAVKEVLSKRMVLNNLDALVENVVRRRLPSWIKQVEAIGNDPLRTRFSSEQDAKERLAVLQRNGLHSHLAIRSRKSKDADEATVFDFVVPGFRIRAIQVLMPIAALVALGITPIAEGDKAVHTIPSAN